MHRPSTAPLDCSPATLASETAHDQYQQRFTGD
jgi:hypothetical protein